MRTYDAPRRSDVGGRLRVMVNIIAREILRVDQNLLSVEVIPKQSEQQSENGRVSAGLRIGFTWVRKLYVGLVISVS